MSEKIVRKNKLQKAQNPLTISAQYGLIDQETFFKKKVASKDLSGYYLIKKGEFAYNKSYSSDYPWGAIKRLDLYDEGALSTLYILFSPKNINSDFLAIYYETTYWYKEIAIRAAEGARNHGLLNISSTDFFDTELKFPLESSEQTKIGTFFSKFDSLITLQQEKIEKLKELKKGYLEKLFPKHGKNIPEIRFEGFNDVWEEQKLGTICDVFTDGDWIEAKDQSNSGIRLIQTGNIGITTYLEKINNKKWISEKTFEKLNCKEIYAGDILISRLPEPAGRACIVPKLETRMITAVDCTIVRTSEQYSNQYLIQYLSTPIYFKDVNSVLGGGTRQRISRGNLSEINIPIPSLKEQTKIGSFFSNLDGQVQNEESKLENLKLLKKEYLRKMFI